MSDYSREDLLRDIAAWLRDDNVLTRTRSFLGGHGLNEVKIANWNRPKREIPETFIEGAALNYCARAEVLDAKTAERTRLKAREYWQVFAVSAMRDRDGNHDCTVFRYWTGVQRT